MTNLVNKNDLAGAHRSKQLLDPAIEALKKINVQALGFDPYSLEKVSAFIAWLEKFGSKADATITQGRLQYENRPRGLITAALLRMSTIPPLIESEQKTIQRKTENHKAKTEELQKQGFGPEEIVGILQDPQNENDGHAANIAALRNEQRNLEDFLASGPIYNTDLLDMEKLAPFLQNRKPAE